MKLKQNSFETALYLFCFSFISLCGQFNINGFHAKTALLEHESNPNPKPNPNGNTNSVSDHLETAHGCCCTVVPERQEFSIFNNFLVV